MPLLWAFDLEEEKAAAAAGMMAVATWVVLFPSYPYESSQPLSLGGGLSLSARRWGRMESRLRFREK